MAVGHSDDVDLDSALEEIFGQCDAALAGAAPTAGLLLSTWDADHRAIIDAVRARYPDIELAGSTSGGEMSSVVGFTEDSIALALFASDDIDIVAGLGRGLTTDPAAGARQAVAEATAKTAQPPRLCIVLTAIGPTNVGTILEAFRSALGPGVPVVGGGATPSDPMDAPDGSGGLEFAGDVVATDALAILLFCGPVAVSFGVDTGWRGVGPRATVTRSSGGVVYEIDGRPALEFYERYVGTGQPSLANPLAVFEDATSDRFYLRTAITYDQAASSAVFFGAVPEGSTVQLTMAAVDQVVDGTRASISQALAAFPSGARPDGALLFACATRKFLLGTRARQEIAQVRDVLGGSVPVSGLYCLGEIAPTTPGEASRFHNSTMVSVLLGSLGPDEVPAA